jgi:hypothetical protein
LAAHGLNELEGERKAEFEAGLGVAGGVGRVKDLADAGGWQVGPVVADTDGEDQAAVRFGAVGGDGDGDLILNTDVDGVREEDADDLAKADGVAEDDFRGIGFAGLGEKVDEQTAGLGAGLHGGDGGADYLMEMKGGFGELELAGHDGGIFEGVAEGFQEIFGAKAGGLDVFALLGGKGGLEQKVGHTENAGEGGADLMIERGEHSGMGPLQILHGFEIGQKGGVAFRQVGSYGIFIGESGLHV